MILEGLVWTSSSLGSSGEDQEDRVKSLKLYVCIESTEKGFISFTIPGTFQSFIPQSFICEGRGTLTGCAQDHFNSTSHVNWESSLEYLLTFFSQGVLLHTLLLTERFMLLSLLLVA